MAFYEYPPQIDLIELERKVNEDIAKDMAVHYADDSHIRVGDRLHFCSGPRTHVTSTGKVQGFRLCHDIIFDTQRNRYLLIGFVGEHSEEHVRRLQQNTQSSTMMNPIIY